MPTKHLTAPPTPQRVAPARVNPCHLPALHHVAADLDGLDHPVRIVNPAELGECEGCTHDDTDLDAIAEVVAEDADGFRYRSRVCALHLTPEVRYHARHGRVLTVEVPAASRQWFERADRETYIALDESRGVGVSRTHVGGWAAWTVLDGITVGAPLAVFASDHGDPHARLTAECWAQDHAATLAAHEYETAQAVTVALPVQDVTTEVAA